MKRPRLATAFVTVVLLTACGSGSEETVTEATANGATSDPTSQVAADGAAECSTSPEGLQAAIDAMSSSPLASSVDIAEPASLDEVMAQGYTQADTGTIRELQRVGNEPSRAFDEELTELTGTYPAWSGYDVVVQTPTGDVTVPLALAAGGPDVVERLNETVDAIDLTALVGACVLVVHGGDATDPLAQGRPQILAAAAAADQPAIPFAPHLDAAVGSGRTLGELEAEATSAL